MKNKPYHEETLGTEKATELATDILRYSEAKIMKTVVGQVRYQVIKQMAGIFKNFYLRPDGTYGHTGIENIIRANALDKIKGSTE